ncbi:MAG: gamma-glutamyltransferase family protein [Alphaproteobacteria bacterium]|nr:gamma-glutamyltransferase family protein [Alphaproteobacteria bacterium]
MARNFSLPGRSAVRAQNGMITTSHPIATAAGLKVLAEGGSAVDAAITATSLLSVAEPQMTGIGGDCFALVSKDGSTDIIALNGAGRAPANASGEGIRAQGLDAIPRHSPHAVTIPGAVDAWAKLHEKFGRHDWDRLFAPSIDYATNGIAVHDRVARDWGLHPGNVEEDKDAAEQFLKNGAAYQAGDVFRQPKLAEAFKLIAKNGRDGFYNGPVMEDMLAKLTSMGGFHQDSDFINTEASFVTPISADYKGHTIWECPPNGQGVAALVLIRIVEQFDLAAMDDVDRVHVLAEASKIAYRLRDTYVADPDREDVPVDWLLSDESLATFVSMIDMKKAQPFDGEDFPTHPHTIYLAAVDKDGMAVSLINSIFDDFGSGISTPGYGVLFQSRGRAFRVDDHHPNRIAGGKRPLHTIIPGMITKGDQLVGPFGVMGGQYQAAGHAMLMSNLFAHGMNPQQALDAARSFGHAGVLQLEGSYSPEQAAELERRGHVLDYPSAPIGGGQAILRDLDTGVLVAGSDPRKDGMSGGF